MNQSLLHQVEQRISEDSVPSGGKHFGGAGLIVSDDPKRHSGETTVIVVSPFAGEISWVVERMKEVFADSIEGLNKYSFYPEMGRAALAVIAAQGSRTEILLAIVDEAKNVWSNRPLSIKTDFENALGMLNRPAYFAYGRNLSHKVMKKRCPDAVFFGPGLVAGFRFLIKKRGVATLAADSSSEVYGGIYLLTESDVAALDECEGVAKGCYEKRTIPANGTDNGDAFACLVYIDLITEPGLPRLGYLRDFLEGAIDCRLPSSYVSFLRTLAGSPD